MTSKNTPGPWQVNRSDPTTLIVVSPWSDVVKPGTALGWGDYRGIHIATLTHHATDGGAVPPTHAYANARLIAAAPDLLDAAKAARKKIAMYAQSIPGSDETLASLDAAIAKAEGRS